MREPGMVEGVRLADLARAVEGDRRAADLVGAALRDDDPDHDLLDAVARRAADGSPVALDLLVAAIDDLPIMRAPIRRLLVDPDAVEDVAQDVLISVAERIGSFRGDARFTTWLFQVARFKTIDHLRRQRDSTTLDDEGVERLSDRERISSMIASRASIRHALDDLPAYYRTAVLLRDFERVPYREIAEREAVPLNTAKARVARGRALLAAKLSSTS